MKPEITSKLIPVEVVTAMLRDAGDKKRQLIKTFQMAKNSCMRVNFLLSVPGAWKPCVHVCVLSHV